MKSALWRVFVVLMVLLCTVAARAADTTPPTVSSASPSSGNDNVWLDADVTATFSETMSAGTINSNNFIVRKGLVRINGDLSYNAATNTVKFSPYAPFETGVTYTAIATTDIQDSAGNHMTDAFTWSFTTTTRTNVPDVLYVSPADTASGVGLNATVEVEFSDAMEPDTITSASFIVAEDLNDVPATQVAGTIYYDALYRKAIFTPTAELTASTTYHGYLTSAIKSYGGQAISSEYQWSFGTSGHTHTIAATWVTNGTDPNVWTTGPISVTFDEAMMPTTINTDSFTLTQNGNPIEGTVYYNSILKKASFYPTEALTPNTDYVATINDSAYCSSGVVAFPSSETLSFTTTADVTGPSVVSTLPGDGATNVWVDATVSVEFGVSMSDTSFSSTSFLLKKGATKIAATSIVYTDGTKTVVFTPESPLDPDTLYTAVLTSFVKDANGNGLAAERVWTFTTTSDTTPPTITGKSPASGASNVSITAPLVVTFSEEMDQTTLDATSIVLTDTPADIPNNLIPVAVSIDPQHKVVTLQPTAVLDYNTTYTVLVPATDSTGITNALIAKDASGNPLAGDVTWTFTTTNTNTVPTVVDSVPADTDSNVWVTAPITVEFDIDMDPATINSSTFKLDHGVTGTVSYDVATKVATFTPDAPLAASTTYQVDLTSGITSDKGNALVALNWTFDTTTDTTAAVALMTDPADASFNVPIQSAIDISFNDDMTAATIDETTITVGAGSPPVQIPGTVIYVPGAGDGIATFYPDAPLATNTLYTVNVLSGIKDDAGNLTATETFTFTTTNDGVTPHVVSFTPASGAANVWLDTVVAVTFSEQVDMTSVDATSFAVTESGTPVAGSFSQNAEVVTFTPDDPLTKNKTYVVALSTAITDSAGNALLSGVNFSFTTMNDNTPPTASTSTAATGVVWDPVISVTFSEQMAASTINDTTVYLCASATPLVHLAGTVSYDPVTKTATITPSALLGTLTSYDINVTTGAKDANGVAMAGAFLAAFTTRSDLSTPSVSSTVPTDTSTDAWPGADITATFSEALRPDTINGTSFTVVDSLNAAVPGVVSYTSSPSVATFNPDSALTMGETYTATITTDATDLAGRKMAADKVWTFTVSSDIVAPTVTAVSPAADTSNVWTGVPVTAAFSEQISLSTLTTATFTVVNSLANPVTGGVTYDPFDYIATFTPAGNLALNMEYTATLNGVRDLGGNLLAPKSWKFTTTADGTAPTIAGHYPAGGATNVSIYETPSVTFSESMLITTINATNFSLDCGGAVDGAVAYNSVTRTATFNSTDPLPRDADCTATVKGDISDLGGNTLGSDYTWTFKINNDQIAPSVTSFVASPLPTLGKVWRSAVFVATFSKAMTASTITTANMTMMVKATEAPITGSVAYSSAGGIYTATFTPDALLDLGETYTVTVTEGVLDSRGNKLAADETLDVTVTSDDVAPTVSSNNPAIGAINVWRDIHPTITFSEDVASSTVSTTTVFLKQGSTPVAATVAVVDNVATITPSAALAANTVYTANVTTGVKDLNGNAIANAYTYNFTTTADTVEPAITTFSPASGAINVARKPTVSVTFSEPLTGSTVNDTTFLLNNGAIAGTVTYDASTKTAKFVPTNLLGTSTTYTVKVSKNIKDLNGNPLTTDGSWTFTTTSDSSQPSLIAWTPDVDATGIWANTSVTAKFDKTLTVSSITSANFNLKVKATGASVSGTITYDPTSSTARLTPTSALARNTTFTATVTTGILDSVGNALTAGKVWDFTTTNDSTAPTITSVTPDVNATSVWSDVVLSAVFNEALETTTVGAAVFTLKDGTTPVEGTVSLSDGNTKINFTPAAALSLNKVYTATVTTGVKDTSGNPLASAKVWNFTTTNDTIMPTVASSSPAHNATLVSQLVNPTITFSESMTASTITTTTLKLNNGADVGGSVSYDAPSRTATFVPAAPLTRDTVYTLTAKADMRDLGGNKMTADKVISFRITTDGDAPVFAAGGKFPAENEQNAWRSTTVKATFQEPMTASSITSSSFLLKQGANSIAGTVAYDAATYTAIFTPNALLAANTTYSVTVVASVLDAGGNALGEAGTDDVTWTFKTTNDATAPTVTSTVPAASATGVWRTGAPVKAVFSEAMASSTITTATFYLMQGTSLVPGSVAYDSDTMTASFTPTNALSLNTGYTAYVTTGVKDSNGNPLAAIKTWAFTATNDSVVPSVASTSPVLGAAGVSRIPTLSMVFSEAMSASTITGAFTLKTGVTNIPVTAAYNAATFTSSFTPNSALDPNTVYTATLTTAARDAAGNQIPADYTWTFTTSTDVTAPTVLTTYPTDASVDNSTLAGIIANFSEPMTASTISASSFTLTRTDGDPDVAVPGTVTYTSNGNYATFQPTAALVRGAEYEARVTTSARDGNGVPMAADKVWSFTVSTDNVAPSVTGTLPAANATNVWQSQVITITFNEAMYGPSFTTSTFVLKVGTSVVPGTVAYDAATKTASYTPTSPLARGTVYNATVSNTVKDFTGNNLGTSKLWSFTTTTDTILPTVTAVSPISLATSVNRATTLTATFSDAMASSTITTTTFSLKKGTTSIPGTVGYNSSTKTATFTPTSILASGSSFTATLNGVRDANGNGLAAAYTWTFTTTSDSVAPTVTSKSPATGATSVSRKPTITVVFSEAMDSTTLTTANCTLKTAAPGNVPVTVTLAYNSTTRTLSMTPSALLDISQDYTAALSTSVRDANGNPLATFAWTFTTTNDNVAPSAPTITPANSATAISKLTSVTAVFTDNMEPSTFNTTTFTLMTGTTTVASTITYDAATKTATLKPNAVLLAGTVYNVKLTAGVTDTAGNPLTQFTSSFTTSTDVSAPTVSSTFPAANATGISMISAVYANFNESMAESSFTSSTFYVKQGTTTIPGTITYYEQYKRALWRPTGQMARNTLYTVTITTGARDAAGNALAANKSWSFTTTTDSLAPTIISTSPAADVGGVDVSSTIVATFSEAMTVTTQSGLTLSLNEVPVTGTYAWDATKKILTLTPDAPLTEGGRYTVTLSNVLKDTAGNSVDDYSYDFVVAPGTYFEPFTGVEFVWVNPGTFDMGDTLLAGEADESPAHSVVITKGYWISKYELTQEQWYWITGNNPSYFQPANGFLECPECPVETISFNNVQGYLALVNMLSGKNIDLPTEAQWEYAARGGPNGAGFQYSGADDPDMVAIYDTTESMPVALLFQNELGIYDMSGNVWEMCSDWYSATEYTADTVIDPVGPVSGAERVVRGGGWDAPATELRVSNRKSVLEGNGYGNLGVRLVLKP